MNDSLPLGPWRQHTDRVWSLIAEPDSVTIGLVVGDDACLLVDTGSTPDQGRDLRARITEVTNRPLTDVVVTHGHRDHWFGLAAFDDLRTRGHESLLDLSPADLSEDLTRLGLAESDIARPNTPLSLVAGVDLGNQWVEVLHLGGGHSPSDVIVVVGAEHVVFPGDLIETTPDSQGRPAPWYGPDSDPKAWAEAVDGILGAMTDDSWLAISGHGEPARRDEATFHRGAHSMVLHQISQLAARGVDPADAESAGDWPWDWERVAPAVTSMLTHRPAGSRQLPLL